MRIRVVLAAVAGLAFIACGLTVTGVGLLDGGSTPTPTEGGALDDAGVPGDGSPIEDASTQPDVAPPATGKCKEICPDAGGTCKGETCIFAPTALGAVKCPPGIACEVTCAGTNACKAGVDCSAASDCKITCSGVNSCMDSPLKCGGKTCALACDGVNACKAGVLCTATDKCDVKCTGVNACMDKVLTCAGKECDLSCSGVAACKAGVVCSATDVCKVTCDGDDACMDTGVACGTQGDCTVVCGKANAIFENDQCKAGVACDAGKSCDITCVGSGACRDKRLVANADGKAIVTCGDGNNCVAGVAVGGAGSAEVKCGSGFSCEHDIQCRSKKCKATCPSSGPTRLCCGPQASTCDTTNCDTSSDLTTCN